jgi:hypothetical protein
MNSLYSTCLTWYCNGNNKDSISLIHNHRSRRVETGVAPSDGRVELVDQSIIQSVRLIDSRDSILAPR